MSYDTNRLAVECHCTRCIYNSNRTCNYQGRLKLNSNGDCETKETRSGGFRFDGGRDADGE